MPTVHLPRLLDPATDGRRALEVEATDVGEVIKGLIELAPKVEVHLFDHGGALRPHVLCFVDGVATRLEDRSARVGERSEIRFVQAVSGG